MTSGLPDLIVTSVSWTPTRPAIGDHVTFSATVKNQGTAATPAGVIIGVGFSVDGNEVTWSDTDTTSLAPGASVTLTANYGSTGSAAWTATSGSHTVQANVDDVNRIAESNESNNTLSRSLTVRSLTSAVKQVNCGGSAASPFVADTGFSGGNMYSDTSTSINTTGVTNPAPQAVYQTCRWAASFSYTLGSLTANNTYKVRLHFAELTWTAAGQRKFNVAINGTTVLSAFDIFAAAGATKKAIVKEFTVTANGSGQIVIAFSQAGVDNPEINGIEILQ